MDELSERRKVRRAVWWNATGRQLVFDSIALPVEAAVAHIAGWMGREEAEVRAEVVRTRAAACPTCGGSKSD